MTSLKRTPVHPSHVALGAKMVDFAGWDMPLIYPTGTVAEHLATRRRAGLFDVSHMGRFTVGGPGRSRFLQRVLSNNAAALDVGQAQYTFIPTETGGAVDDAYLYRFVDDEYLLVVNAANREKDWEHLQERLATCPPSPPPGAPAEPAVPAVFPVTLEDRTTALAMLSLQGPLSRDIVSGLLDRGTLPEPRRNELSIVTIAGYPSPPRPHGLHRRAAVLRALRARRSAPRALGSSRRKRSRSLWPRRAGHLAPGSRPAPLRPRAGERPGRPGDPPDILASGRLRRQLLPGQGRLRRPRRRSCASRPPTAASSPATTPSSPTCPA